jgi:lipopolysaccharide transport system ATP-binding protein
VASSRTRVAVEGVSKKFARSLKKSFVYGAEEIVRAAMRLPPNQKLRESEFWALRDVSFTLKEGQSIGIVGLNGSGKTTLLRIISSILRPTRGQVRVNGLIAPMLALGAGFKPVLSGRENVFLNMSLLGVPPETIRRRFDAVVEFADIGQAIEAPLGTYSTGMRTRLGFACAILAEPEILIVDEVLSVGDARFRMKCRNKMNELRRNGVSMLLVSHSSISVETLCDECVYLRKGRLAAIGTPKEVLARYNTDEVVAAARHNDRVMSNGQPPSKRSLGGISLPTGRPIQKIVVRRANGEAATSVISAEQCCIEVVFQSATPVEDASVNLIIVDQSHNTGERMGFISSRSDVGPLRLEAGETRIGLSLTPVVLRSGAYQIKASVSSGPLDDIIDVVDGFRFVVERKPGTDGSMPYQPHIWSCNGRALPSRNDRPLEMVIELDDTIEP